MHDSSAPPPSLNGLERLCAQALARPATQLAIEFGGQWFSWGDMARVATQVAALIAASGCPAHAPIGFVPRNRPSAIAALFGLIARGSHVRMIYAFQSPAAIARDVARLAPAVVIAAAADISDEVRAVLA
ncbi:MAG: hypothetical protein QM661_10750, partial [Solimonas sp.]